MATAVLYGALASSSFVVGVLLGLVTTWPRRLVASVIAFGAGVLVSALTFELMQEAFEKGAAWFAITGFLVGALIYVIVDLLLERMAAASPKRTGRDPQDVVPAARKQAETHETAALAGTALLAGALLDGIPENAAIGVSLHAEGSDLGLVLLAAVFLGNVPERASAARHRCTRRGGPVPTSSACGVPWRSRALLPPLRGTPCSAGCLRTGSPPS